RRQVVSTDDMMPGSGFQFHFFSPRPALDGPYVAFHGHGPADPTGPQYGEGVFVWDETGGLRVLADLSTPIPDGNGTFARFSWSLDMEAETVFFFGEDADGHGGLYAADVVTGALIRLVDRNVPVAGSSAALDSFFHYPSAGEMGSGVGVVFTAQTGVGIDSGLYLWQDGTVRPLALAGDILDGYYRLGSFEIGPESFDGERVAFKSRGIDVSVPFPVAAESVWAHVVGGGSPVPGPSCQVDDFEDDLLDPAWTLVGLGNANQESAAESGGVLSLTADGATAFYGADNAGFLYRQMGGDFRLEATVDGSTMTTGGRYRKAGLMVRAGLDSWDERLLALLVPYWDDRDETHLQFVARDAFGQPGSLPVAEDVVGVPRTVRLAVERRGQELAVEYSLDGGATWIRPTTGLGGSIAIPTLPPELYVGLAMVSNDISVTSTALFDDASICPLP
ncbi:MAG: DUF1349 domain-containing protein, partial [Holophagales bacterium]|nr:DUF1349 domain-containing protein [Holophagales bacterium]